MAEINVNLKEGSFSINGSEEFIEKHMTEMFNYLEKNIGALKTDCEKNESTPLSITEQNYSSPTKSQGNDILAQTNSKDRYKKAGIYSVDEESGEVSIHRKLPGKTKAEKTKNVAFIVLYEKGEIQGSELKTLCEKQGCWDKSNAAAIFERDIVNFIKKKKSTRVWTLSLTIDGEAAAKALMEDMINSDN